MYHFGARSEKNLSTVDTRLVKVARFALKLGLIDFSVICGRRSEADQNAAYQSGQSKLTWPLSKHNVINEDDLAIAIDAVPFINGKLSWKKEHCIYLAALMQSCGRILSIPIRWGGNWDMDGEPVTDQNFNDLVHFELTKT